MTFSPKQSRNSCRLNINVYSMYHAMVNITVLAHHVTARIAIIMLHQELLSPFKAMLSIVLYQKILLVAYCDAYYIQITRLARNGFLLQINIS